MLTIIAKRLFSVVSVCATGSWSLFVGTVDAFDHANTAKSILLAAGMPEWLFPPWWGPVLSCAVLTGFVIWLNWPAPAVAQQAASQSAPSLIVPALVAASAAPKRERFLSDAMIATGIPGRPPEYRARFAQSGREARFYVEYSAFYSGLGVGGWTQPIKLLMRDVPRFAQGEMITLSVVRDVQTNQGLRWQFGTGRTTASQLTLWGHTSSFAGA